MSYQVANVLAALEGIRRGKAKVTEQRRREQQTALETAFRAARLQQAAAVHRDAEGARRRMALGQLFRTPTFDPDTPQGQTLQQEYLRHFTSGPPSGAGPFPRAKPRTDPSTSPPAAEPVREPTESGGFLRSRRAERGFTELGIQTRELQRQAEKARATSLAKQAGGLVVRLQERTGGLTPTQAAAELDDLREQLRAAQRAQELAAELKASRSWLEKSGERRALKPGFEAEHAVLAAELARAGTGTAVEAQAAEALLQRVRTFRGQSPFGAPHPTANAEERQRELIGYRAHRTDDRYREQVRRAQSPAVLLESLQAQREHARQHGLPLSGTSELDETPGVITVRNAILRPGDHSGGPMGPAKPGPQTTPTFVEVRQPEPGALRQARRLQAAAPYAGTMALREVTLRKALGAYGLVIRSGVFETLNDPQRQQVLAAANEVRGELGLPAFPAGINERLTPAERQALGVRDATAERDNYRDQLQAVQKQVGQVLLAWRRAGALTSERQEEARALQAGLKDATRLLDRPPGRGEDWDALDRLGAVLRELTQTARRFAGEPERGKPATPGKRSDRPELPAPPKPAQPGRKRPPFPRWPPVLPPAVPVG